MVITLIPVESDLPQGFQALRIEAAREGYRHVDRLQQEWFDGKTRFDLKGECLLAALVGDDLAGLGGMTIEPNAERALRLRRFYVHPRWRRIGVGRTLARELLHRAKESADVVTVNAGSPAAAVFWETLGFLVCEQDGYTHIWQCR